MSIARRVAQERGWEVGGIVGYQVIIVSETFIYFLTLKYFFLVSYKIKNINLSGKGPLKFNSM